MPDSTSRGTARPDDLLGTRDRQHTMGSAGTMVEPYTLGKRRVWVFDSTAYHYCKACSRRAFYP